VDSGRKVGLRSGADDMEFLGRRRRRELIVAQERVEVGAVVGEWVLVKVDHGGRGRRSARSAARRATAGLVMMEDVGVSCSNEHLDTVGAIPSTTVVADVERLEFRLLDSEGQTTLLGRLPKGSDGPRNAVKAPLVTSVNNRCRWRETISQWDAPG
jgi:hypothetical protein